IERVSKFTVKAERLRRLSDSVELWVGNELTIDALGIRKGATYVERVTANDPPNVKTILNNFLNRLITVSRANFNGKITYAAGLWEPVEWRRHDFDIIGSNEYFWPNRDSIKDKINRLKRFNKPVYITEFGSCTYEGACKWGGAGSFHDTKHPYDEDEQVNCIEKYLKIFNGKVHGCFLWIYRENEPRYFGIVTSSLGGVNKRKKGFYMYKSYRRSP
ncbi:MAG: hypothetical protein QW390_02265, partial [Candidatus Bathyarchaeia archaeon]